MIGSFFYDYDELILFLDELLDFSIKKIAKSYFRLHLLLGQRWKFASED